MKKYYIYRREQLIAKYTKKQYDHWVENNAKRNYGLYRITGSDPNDYGIDFDIMFHVKVIEESDK